MKKARKFKQLGKFGYYSMWVFISICYLLLLFFYTVLNTYEDHLLSQIFIIMSFFVCPTSILLYGINHIFMIVHINNDGVNVRGLFNKLIKSLHWDEIADVGLGMNPQFNGTKNIVIYFANRKLHDYEILKIYDYNKSKEVILLRYDKVAYNLIKEYYHGKIRFEEYIEAIDSLWLR